VCRHIVMEQQPVSVLPHLRPFAPHIFPQSSQNLAVHFPASWIVRLLSYRITSRTFTIISGVVHVDGQPEYLRSSTDSRPSLKRLINSNVYAWLNPYPGNVENVVSF
jgi:hypothetical protein